MMGKLQKLASGEFGARSGGGRRPNRWRSIWIRTEHLLLGCGLALLAVYGAARIDSFLGSRAALKEFAALDSSATAASQNGEEDMASSQDVDSGEVDFSLWDKRRVDAYPKSLSGQSGAPLGVLRISKIDLAVPVLEGTDDRTLNHAVGRIAGTDRPGGARKPRYRRPSRRFFSRT